MAEFCKQCHLELFPSVETFDFEGFTTEQDTKERKFAVVLCEGCGTTYVNHKGECVGDCDEHHGDIPLKKESKNG